MFTADQAFEAHDDGEPIFIDQSFAKSICVKHDALLSDFLSDNPYFMNEWSQKTIRATTDPIDAADLLAWLGY